MRPLHLVLLAVRRAEKKKGLIKIPAHVQQVAEEKCGWTFRTEGQTVKQFAQILDAKKAGAK